MLTPIIYQSNKGGNCEIIANVPMLDWDIGINIQLLSTNLQNSLEHDMNQWSATKRDRLRLWSYR
jgi:hypothetical protein